MHLLDKISSNKIGLSMKEKRSASDSIINIINSVKTIEGVDEELQVSEQDHITMDDLVRDTILGN